MEFGNRKLNWARSSVGLERTPDKREVGSSNLPGPIILWKLEVAKPKLENVRISELEFRISRDSGYRGRSSTGRAPALQAGGCRFEPDRLHYIFFVSRKMGNEL